MVLHRNVHDGGLGLFHVRIRSLALLIRSFLETSANPGFRHSLLHEVLFRYHVLEETFLPNPGFLPYYDQQFFNTIKHYKQNSPLNISLMTTRQWYRALLEDRVLMLQGGDVSPPVLLPVRVEQLVPDHDWAGTWILMKTKGLNSDQSSFLFKLLHQLLPTQNRIHRITNEPGLCKVCNVLPEDLDHALFTCPSSKTVADLLLSYVHTVVPGMSTQRLLRLDFGARLDDTDQLAILGLVSTGLTYIWQARAEKKVLTQYKMRAELEAMISILRKSRFTSSADKIFEIIV